MLYINAPGCWSAAQRDQSLGQFNHLVLPNIEHTNQYRWPVGGCVITGVDFGNSGQSEIEHLIAVLAEAEAVEVAIRQMLKGQIIAYLREEQESVA